MKANCNKSCLLHFGSMYVLPLLCRNLDDDAPHRAPVAVSQIEIQDDTADNRPVDHIDSGDNQQPIRVVRADDQPIKVVRGDNTKNSAATALDSKSRSAATEREQLSSEYSSSQTEKYDYRLRELRDTHIGGNKKPSHEPPLVDTHIGRAKNQPSSASHDRTITLAPAASKGASNRSFEFEGGLLWPDVIDPYHRGQELELRIGNTALDVFQCRSLTTITKFHK